MHLQIRTAPALSPANLEAFLQVLADKGINMKAVGGHDIEAGGEFFFAVTDGEECDAMLVLAEAGYKPRLVAVSTCELSDVAGQLLECIMPIRKENEASGRVIRDITVGVANADGLTPVQVYSE